MNLSVPRLLGCAVVLATLGTGTAQRLAPGATLELPVPSGGGPRLRRVECPVGAPGVRAMVRIFAECASHDAVLRVEGRDGRLLAEDRDTGPVHHAFVGFDVEGPEVLRIQVGTGPGKAAGTLRLRCTVSPDTAATLAAAREAAEACPGIATDLRGGRAKAARRRLREVVDELDRVAGARQSPAIQREFERLLELALRSGELVLAARCAESRRQYCVDTLPRDHPARQLANADAARVAHAWGYLPGAVELLAEVLEVFERTLPRDHPQLLAVRSNHAGLLVDLGDLETAEHLQRQVVEAFAKQYPKGHPRLWVAQQNLAATWKQLGDLRRAKDLQEAVIRSWQGSVGDEHPSLQTVRLNLAGTLTALGDLQGARTLAEKVVWIRSRTLPAEHPALQAARTNLAAILLELGEREAAAELQRSVVEIQTRTRSAIDPRVWAARENLGVILAQGGDLAAAGEAFAAVVAARERDQPAHHPELFQSRVNLASLRLAQGEPAAARVLLEKALDAVLLPETDPFRLHAEVELARSLARLEQQAQLLTTLGRIGHGVERRLLESGATLTPRRCAAVAAQARRAIAAVLAADSTELEPPAFRIVEAARGLELIAYRMARGLRGATPEQRLALEQLRTRLALQRRRIADLAQAGEDPRELRRALAEREALESELCRSRTDAAGLRGALAPVTPASVAAKLARGEVAVGYWRVSRGDRGEYRAFVVDRAGALHAVELGGVAAIDDAVRDWRRAVTEQGPEVTRSGRRLRRLLVDPVRKVGPDARVWRVALDGPLHLVPLDGLPEEGNAVVGDRHRMVRVHTLRVTTRTVEGDRQATSLLLVGGVDYGPGRLPPLGATRREMRAVEQVFATAFPAAKPVRLSDGAATRTAVVAAATPCRFVHLATHAWFAPDSVPSVRDPAPVDRVLDWGRGPSMAEMVRGFSPMVLCGLAFSGANRPGGEGILTAEELSGCDLSRCELAVLSGCETALGLPRFGQGLASLQQALHIAGARASITALWKVPDRATRKLMTAFYENLWVRNLPPAQALWAAKRGMRDAEDEAGRPEFTPRDWAGWVLTRG